MQWVYGPLLKERALSSGVLQLLDRLVVCLVFRIPGLLYALYVL